MWSFKKAIEKEIPEKEIPQEKPIIPKHTKRKVIMKIIVANNKTDCTYTIESENNFGLSISGNSVNDIFIYQNNNVNGSACCNIARLNDFSLIRIIWEEFDITQDNIE